MLRLIINGRPQRRSRPERSDQCPPTGGSGRAAVSRRAHHPFEGCRLCVVEIEGQPRPVASCTPWWKKACRSAPIRRRCIPFEKPISSYWLSITRPKPSPPAGLAVSSTPARTRRDCGWISCNRHPLPRRYPSLYRCRDGSCIHCDRCIRICDELQGQFVWEAIRRGDATYVAPGRGETMLEGGCVSCGACADYLSKRRVVRQAQSGATSSWTRSTCVYCGCRVPDGGWRIRGRIVAVRPADSPVNRGHLCVKGRYAFEFNQAHDRVSTPMIRRDGVWETTTWDAALEHISNELLRIRATHGADAVGAGFGSREQRENYLTQKFARVVLGTNNVDCCARVCHTPSVPMKSMLGTGASTTSTISNAREPFSSVAPIRPKITR